MWLLITALLMLTNVVFACIAIYYREKCKNNPVCDDQSPTRYYDGDGYQGRHYGTFVYGRQDWTQPMSVVS